MNSRNSNFFLGLFTFALLINLMLIEKNEQSSNYLKLFASFNKIDGVKIGTNILVSGVEIGSVEKINLESNFPTLTMKIRNDIKIIYCFKFIRVSIRNTTITFYFLFKIIFFWIFITTHK